MHSWGKIQGSDDSFMDLFQQLENINAPEDRPSSSRSIKELSLEEIHSSGPSLRGLEKLDVDQLTLGQGYDHSWAMDALSTYGPMGHPQSWEREYAEDLVPDTILDENSVVKYIEEAFLKRALCGGFFLFSLAKGLGAMRCPSRNSCKIVNQSSSGPSGRPDLQLVRNGKLCDVVEVKRKRVCISDGIDILDKVRQADLLYGEHGCGEDGLKCLTSSQKKATTLIYQVC